MKIIGLIGGVSPESTMMYYRLLNDAVRNRLGGEHSAHQLICSLDYGVMIRHYKAGDWPSFIEEVSKGAECLAAAGADVLAICSNTTHIAADAAAAASGAPLIHIIDVLADALTGGRNARPLLLGTPVVMAGPHYRDALSARYDGEVSIPTKAQQDEIGRIILDELVNGEILSESKNRLKEIIAAHEQDGVDSVILGCTELCMILSQDDFDMPVYDTTALHVAALADFALRED